MTSKKKEYEASTVAVLRNMAKERDIKKVSQLKKADLIEALLKQDKADAKGKAEAQKKDKEPQKKETATKKTAGQKTADKKTKAPKVAKKTASDSSEQKDDKAQNQKEEKCSDDESISRIDGYAKGFLELVPDESYGFIRSENYLTGADDVYVGKKFIKGFELRTGDIIEGSFRKDDNEKFPCLVTLEKVNELDPEESKDRPRFESLEPMHPEKRLKLEFKEEGKKEDVAMRIIDLMSPIGKGQRGLIVSPPKAGKTTLMKNIGLAIQRNNPEVYMIVLLIDERPEEVTELKAAIEGPNAEVIYSTFDEEPIHHVRVAEMVTERAKRLVEQGKDVVILLDSLTRLTRAYNQIVQPSGRTLSGGLDPTALYMPKKFFGAARNLGDYGSLTIIATALIGAGGKMDDIIYEEFKGTGNMDIVLDRNLSSRRIFPPIDIINSGTRKEELLLNDKELHAVKFIRETLAGPDIVKIARSYIATFDQTDDNEALIGKIKEVEEKRKREAEEKRKKR